MATAIEMLKAVASEIQLSSAFGRWMQKVSVLLDAGVSAPQYLIAKRGGGSAQTLVGLNTTIVPNILGESRGIPYDETQGLATLTPGKTYRLTGRIGTTTFSDATGGRLAVRWVDGNNNALSSPTMDSPEASCVPDTGTGVEGENPCVEMIWTVPLTASVVERIVKLRVTSATGTATIPSGLATMVIQEIPG